MLKITIFKLLKKLKVTRILLLLDLNFNLFKMNFEHLCKTVITNIHRIRSLDRTLWFIKYNYEGFKIRKRRMKLGSIAFDIIDTTFSEVLLRQDVEIRYTRQDNTEADELKLENRLKALNWKWDYSNILAFLIITTFLIIVIYSFFYIWYCNNLPEFAYRNKKYDILVDRSIKILMIDSTLSGMPFVLFSNIMLVDMLLTLLSFFNVLF